MKIGIRLKQFDFAIFLPAFLLTVIGLLVIFSIGSQSNPPDLTKFYKQLIFAGAGLLVFFILSATDYRTIKALGWIAYAAMVFLLVLVLFFGTEIRGTRGWFVLFDQNILQPIEISKPLFLIFLAKFFSDRHYGSLKLSTIFLSLFLTLIPALLGFLQPDFGSPFLFLVVWFGMIILLKAPKKIIAGLFIMALLSGIFAWLVGLEPHQKDRLLTFFNPSSDPLGRGYHVTQSIISVGSGQWFGRGLGLGPQSQLNFLPEQETDFIFAVIAEELGFVGSIVLLALYGIFFFRLLWIAMHSSDPFASFFSLSLLVLFSVQSFINIGMNIGMMPVTGIPLPFVSSGGSQLLASYISLGLLMSIAIRK